MQVSLFSEREQKKTRVIINKPASLATEQKNCLKGCSTVAQNVTAYSITEADHTCPQAVARLGHAFRQADFFVLRSCSVRYASERKQNKLRFIAACRAPCDQNPCTALVGFLDARTL